MRNFNAAPTLDYTNHQREEHHDEQYKGQHHPHAFQVSPLDFLVVRLEVPLAVQWTLSYRPQLAVAVARRRLIQLALWRLEGIDLCVCIVADSLKALWEARRVLCALLAPNTLKSARLRLPQMSRSSISMHTETLTSSSSLYAIVEAVGRSEASGRRSICNKAKNKQNER